MSTATSTIQEMANREYKDGFFIDIETDALLEKEYSEQIPVVFINGNKAFKYHVDEGELEKKVKRLWKT